jgi:seryl-tRNA synthetase
MALFSGRASMLEVQNRALIKTAGERAQRIKELEHELGQAGPALEALERLKAEVKRLKAEVEALRAQAEAYSKKVLELEQHNRAVTEAAIKYSLWGQALERDLARIDPNGALAREFGAWTRAHADRREKG